MEANELCEGIDCVTAMPLYDRFLAACFSGVLLTDHELAHECLWLP